MSKSEPRELAAEGGDAERVRLANEELAVEVVPAEGGRIASLRSLRSGLEFLTQARAGRAAVKPGLKTEFATGPCAGAEECLPTVGASADREGRPTPDHGDFWQIPWTVDATGEDALRMHALGFSRPLWFERQLFLRGPRLHMNYLVRNVGLEPVSMLYAWHPLFAVTGGDRVVLPVEVGAMTLRYSSDKRLAPLGSDLIWPLAQSTTGVTVDLSMAQDAGAETAEMLYTRRLRVGRCGLYRWVERQGVVVSFDTELLPYLGLWLCYGGWPDEPKQVAVALEPTVAPCGTLAEAEATGMTPHLTPGAQFSWSIAVDLTVPNVSYEEFAALVQAGNSLPTLRVRSPLAGDQLREDSIRQWARVSPAL